MLWSETELLPKGGSELILCGIPYGFGHGPHVPLTEHQHTPRLEKTVVPLHRIRCFPIGHLETSVHLILVSVELAADLVYPRRFAKIGHSTAIYSILEKRFRL